jgi:thymidylate synthase
MREYDRALQSIVNSGFNMPDRTGVGCTAKFGISTEYDISKRVPIMTKRKVAYTSIIKEVLWYISGSHSINDLEAMGAKIWTPWKNDAFTEKNNLPQGSAGYIYGFNLIHFGADITDYEFSKVAGVEHTESLIEDQGCNINYKGFNQLDYVINTLRANPTSRQACFTFWRPDTNHKAILPACHAFYSFIVSPDEQGEMNVLNCHLFQRSADYPIGVGMGNLWTATLFVYMIAQQLGMTPGKLYHSAAHAHVYHNALDATNEYLSRDEEPSSPTLTLTPKSSIYDYTVEDFIVSDYEPLPPIKFNIAV